MKKKHRDSPKRIYFDDAIYFVTFYPQNRAPVFGESFFCDLFIEKLRNTKQIYQFNLFGFCILHDHVHLMLMPNNSSDLPSIIHCIKRNFSRDAKKMIQSPSSVSDVSQRRPGEDVNPRLREDMKRRLRKVVALRLREKGCRGKKFRWQKSYHDHYIRNDSDFDYHWDYLAWNPVKHGLSENWPYVSTNPKYYDLTY